MAGSGDARLIRATQLNAYFHDALLEAATRRQVDADAATHQYLTLMLCQFVRSERLFDYDQRRWQLRPLALLYSEALHADSEGQRRLWLQKLGDLALFVGGLFAGRLSRRFQDLDYCVAMGGNAYAYLGDSAGSGAAGAVFSELARNFEDFVQLVAIVTGQQDRAEQGEARARLERLAADNPGLPIH